MKLDPDNAYYHYLLADALAGQALENYGQPSKQDKQTQRLIYPYRVKDRRLLDEAMREVRQGAALPALHTYHVEMLQAQLAQLPTPRYWEDYRLRLAISAGAKFPELASFRSLARATPYFAHVLATEGRTPEAEALLRCWLPMSKQLVENSRTLLEIFCRQRRSFFARFGDCKRLR